MLPLSTFVLLGVSLGVSPALGASSVDWAALNKTVGGRLSVGVPFAQPCYARTPSGEENTPNAEECAQIQKENENHLFRSEYFGSWSLPQWETCQTVAGDECLLDWTNTANPSAFAAPEQCKQGSVPSYYIDVQESEDVRAAYDFTKATGIPLVIKNTGHDYLGRSSAPGSLALWTHNLKGIKYEEAFQPKGCPEVKPQQSMTIGAGVRFQEAYEFAKENNVIFLGGADPSVGASGGWVMGGGHSGLSPAMGLGVDRVLEFKIVTADGEFRTVNKCQHPDLFWALRGGGGGVFGTVLESTFVVSPSVPIQVILGMYTNTRENSISLIKELGKSAVQMASEGWGGYITPSLSSAVWLNPVLSEEEAKRSAAGVIDAFEAVNGSTQFFIMPTYTDFFNTFIGPNADPVGRPQIMASRLIPGHKFHDEVLLDSLATAMVDSDFGQILAVSPYGYKDYDKDGTSINPEFRKSVWQTLMSYFWNYDSSPEFIVGQYKKLQENWATVRQRTKGAATYYNEADVFEPHWKEAFWGNNYDKLVNIKKKYDPNHILDCWHCVGWKGGKDARYKCYPDLDKTYIPRDEL